MWLVVFFVILLLYSVFLLLTVQCVFNFIVTIITIYDIYFTSPFILISFILDMCFVLLPPCIFPFPLKNSLYKQVTSVLFIKSVNNVSSIDKNLHKVFGEPGPNSEVDNLLINQFRNLNFNHLSVSSVVELLIAQS